MFWVCHAGFFGFPVFLFFGFRISDFGFLISDFGFRILDFGFRISDFGFRISVLVCFNVCLVCCWFPFNMCLVCF